MQCNVMTNKIKCNEKYTANTIALSAEEDDKRFSILLISF